MTDALEVLAPAGASVTYRGEHLEILPLTVGALPKVVRAARPIIDSITALDAMPEGDDTLGLVLDLVEHHGERVFEAAALAVGRDPEWVAAGDLSEFVVLAQAVVEVNRDFFVQKLAPLLAARAKASPGDGPTASSSSSTAATH